MKSKKDQKTVQTFHFRLWTVFKLQFQKFTLWRHRAGVWQPNATKATGVVKKTFFFMDGSGFASVTTYTRIHSKLLTLNKNTKRVHQHRHTFC